MKTYQAELAFVGLALLLAVFLSHGGALETVGALAVLFSFAHAQVAERMREKQAAKAKPDVHCHRWSLRYFMAKELLWCSYFVAHKSWSALVGVGVFLAYPLWRKWWRARKPLAPKRVLFGMPSVVFVNARQLELMPKSDIVADDPWSAGLVLRLDRSGCEFVAQLSRDKAGMQLVFKMGGDHLAGFAHAQRLQFFDDPKQPTFRFAALNLAGVGRLQELHSV